MHKKLSLDFVQIKKLYSEYLQNIVLHNGFGNKIEIIAK